MSTKIAIVILNWNGEKLLKQFLPSVVAFSKGPGIEIVIADNGSDDDSLLLIKNEFPEIKILRLNQNYGFAGGYNRALSQLDSEFFVILNSDVEVCDGWLTAPVSLMENDRTIAAVQPKILSFRQKDQFEYAGAAGGFIDRYGYPLCRGRIFNEVETDTGQYDHQVDIFWASGACMFVRSEAFWKAGSFDAGFWAHMEEIDLCWRLKNRGYRIVYTPESSIYHLGGGTLSYNNPQKLYLNFRNNLWLLYKNLPGDQLFQILFIRMLLDGLAAFKLLAEFNFNGIKSVLKAHWHFYKSLPDLRNKRKKELQDVKFRHHRERISLSIVYQFYFRNRKKFAEL